MNVYYRRTNRLKSASVRSSGTRSAINGGTIAETLWLAQSFTGLTFQKCQSKYDERNPSAGGGRRH
jgi:hypothetical protein